MRCRVELLDGVGEFVGAGDALDYNVFVFDAGLGERFFCALEERVDDCCVPAVVDDADAKT